MNAYARAVLPLIPGDSTCHQLPVHCIFPHRCRVRMKGLVANLLFGVLLTLWFSVPSVHADNIYVSTFNLNTVVEFDSGGNQSTFATAGSGLNYPSGLAFDANGNLYVSNSGGGNGNSTIEEFSPNGSGSIFASTGLSYPTGLAFDTGGNLYVSNIGNNTIEEFDGSGTGSVFATAASGLDLPKGLAFDSSGNLYVANYNNTILKFNTGGGVSIFASSGLSNPQGLAFYGGDLYVANAGNNTIEEFNSSGQGSTFTSTNLLRFPVGLAIDSSGDLYVASEGNASIVEFSPSAIGSVFASGFGNAAYLAIDDIPEPSTFLLLGFGAMTLCAFLKRHRA
ncbi:MAG: PEP-CTERM sorting domain-containing protein [Verrucomicrobiia bacterium]